MKPEIGLRRDHAEGEQLCRIERADFLHERRKRDLRLALFVRTEQLPLAKLDPVKKMQAMPAFLREPSRVALFSSAISAGVAARQMRHAIFLAIAMRPENRDSDRSLPSRRKSRNDAAARRRAARLHFKALAPR